MGSGPLHGLRIVELGGIGPVPMCGMLLCDLGAEVIRIERLAPPDLGIPAERKYETMLRGRRSVAVDLKLAAGVAAVLRIIERCDAMIEGFRPGVTERLGLGPDECFRRNPRLVYGRMTGFGQDGPLARAAGHDINYISLAGALGSIGNSDGRPVPPLNLVGDFGGGALYLALGVLAALHETNLSGKGQVVDTAMVDGAASLMTSIYGLYASGVWTTERGHNLLDGGAPFYGVYECADGEWISIGALEQRFYEELVDRLGLDRASLPQRGDPTNWALLRQEFAAVFRTKPRSEWIDVLEGSDVCFAPVLSMAEAPHHGHNAARSVFQTIEGVVQPAPAPRFQRTPGEIQGPVPERGEHTVAVLEEVGFSAAEIEALDAEGVIGRR